MCIGIRERISRGKVRRKVIQWQTNIKLPNLYFFRSKVDIRKKYNHHQGLDIDSVRV